MEFHQRGRTLAPYAWPQTQEDGNGPSIYTGTIPYGVTVGIPASAVEPANIAANPGANMLWLALQDHGAMVRDSTGPNTVVVFQTDQNVEQSNPLIQSMEQYGNEIMSQVQILTNQGSNSVNGGGTPIVPLDPPLSDTPPGAVSPSGTTPLANMTTGTGPDSLVLKISEDAYANGDGTSDAAGDATFIVAIDGKQQGGTFTAGASHTAAADQTFTFDGYFGPGSHTVTVTFLNDAWGGTASTDRNLYVDGLTYKGSNTNQSAALNLDGSQTFTISGGTSPTASGTTTTPSTDFITPGVGSFKDATGNTYTIDAVGNADENGAAIPNGSGTAAMEYYNSAVYGEDAGTSQWYTWNQTTWSAAAAPPSPSSGSTTAVTTGTGSDTLVLSISEDAYANGDGTSDANGDAAFTVSVDGKQLAGTFYATASHSAGASQTFTFKGNWAPGAHTVTVAFLNDAYAGTPSTDRNLYVNDVTYDGTDTKQSAALMSTGSQTFSVTDSTAIPPVVTGGGSDSLVVKVSEDYYLANAQFTVSVDGKQLGGTFTATTLHSSGNSQTFAFAGDFGSGQHTVSVNFLNDAWAGTPATDRNLYVNDIVYNGTDTKQSAALMARVPRPSRSPAARRRRSARRAITAPCRRTCRRPAPTPSVATPSSSAAAMPTR